MRALSAWMASVALADLLVTEDGKAGSYFLSPNDEVGKTAPPKVVDAGRGLELAYGSRAYLMATPGHAHSSAKAADFHFLKLAGRQVNVTVDMQGADCGCNVAFYAVRMPAASPGEGKDWYCDANNVGGNACPEMDLLEANVHSLHTTPHACTKPWTASSCDKGGLPLVFGQGKKDLGAGAGFTIDASRPFTVSNSFAEGRGGRKVLTVTASQGGQAVSKSVTQNVDTMWADLDAGMVLVFSYWGAESMGWLDSPPCKSETMQCAPTVTFRDIATGPAPPPPAGAVGCCSWNPPQCGGAGYCQATRDNCEGPCNGKWIHPAEALIV